MSKLPKTGIPVKIIIDDIHHPKEETIWKNPNSLENWTGTVTQDESWDTIFSDTMTAAD